MPPEWVPHQVQAPVALVLDTVALIVRGPKALAQAQIAAARLTVAVYVNKGYGY